MFLFLLLAGLSIPAAPALAQLTPTTIASLPGGAGGATPFGGVTFDADGNLFGTTYSGGASGNGTVYEVVKGSGATITIASFTGANGSNPYSGVTFDKSGNLFGTTQGGGASSKGTVYEIVKGSGTITVLDSFNGTNGSLPTGDLTFDSAGNLFGTSRSGGAASGGTIYEIAKGGSKIITLASFTNVSGINPFGGITFDSAGNLFGAAAGGGTANSGTVFELVKGGTTVSALDSFTGSNGLYAFGGVTFDAGGNLFGTTNQGGTAGGGGTVYEIAKGTTKIRNLVSFDGIVANGPDSAVTFDGAGNLFGTTPSGGSSKYGTVFKITSGELPKTKPAFTIVAEFDPSSGRGPVAGVTFDSSGNLFGSTNLGGAFNAGTVYELAGVGAPAPIPEASTAASMGLLMGLGFSGLAWHSRKRHRAPAPDA